MLLRRRVLQAPLLLVVAFVCVLVVSRPAHAHPFGPPQTVTIARGDSEGVVRVHWRPGAVDDFSYLAVGIGLVAEDRTQGRAGLFYARTDAETLARSPEFVHYLEQHIVADVAGGPCPVDVEVSEHLVGGGVDLDFACGVDVDAVDLQVSMLTDLHPAYRTLATGPYGQRQVYTADVTRHTWTFVAAAAGPSQGRSAAIQLTVVLLVLGLAVALAAVVARSVRRRRVLA